jgi:ankyrin repeat protein
MSQEFCQACIDGYDINNQYYTYLTRATGNGHFEIVKLLLDAGADPDIPDERGRTPLMIASKKGYDQIIKLLIKKGANLETQDSKGWTPLIHASHRGQVEIVKLLLTAGADINMGLILVNVGGNQLTMLQITEMCDEELDERPKRSLLAFILGSRRISRQKKLPFIPPEFFEDGVNPLLGL